MLPARYVFRRQNIKTNTTPLQIPCLIRDIGIPSTFSYVSFCSFFWFHRIHTFVLMIWKLISDSSRWFSYWCVWREFSGMIPVITSNHPIPPFSSIPWGTHEIEIVTETPEIEKRPAALPSWRMLAFSGRRYDRTGKPCGAQSRKNRTNCYREYTFWFHTKRFLEKKPCSEYAIDSKSRKVV